MPNVTLSFDEGLLKKSRKYAQKRGKSLNDLIRELLAREISQNKTDWLDYCYLLMDRAGANSRGKRWARKDLYEK